MVQRLPEQYPFTVGEEISRKTLKAGFRSFWFGGGFKFKEFLLRGAFKLLAGALPEALSFSLLAVGLLTKLLAVC
jgi:hypothetical protein